MTVWHIYPDINSNCVTVIEWVLLVIPLYHIQNWKSRLFYTQCRKYARFVHFYNLSPHSTLFCNHTNRNFWLVRFQRFYDVFQCDIQSTHWKIGKSSFTHPKSSAWFGCQKSKCADWLSDVPCMPFCPFTCFRIQILSGWICGYRKKVMPINHVNTPFQGFSRDSKTTHSTWSVFGNMSVLL